MRAAFDGHSGYEVDCEGDSFFVAFSGAEDAVAAAAAAQLALSETDWPAGELRVRMGLHTGEPLAVPPNYVGLDVHRAARIMAAAHGGQVLLSQVTRDLLADRVELLDLGEHRLKDLSLPQRLFQLCVERGLREFPPIRTLENRPMNLPVQRTALVGRRKELADLQDLLRDPSVGIVTVTGPGGVGKTRLTLQVGAELIDSFPHGVFFVSLAPLRDPELVLPTIAQTLGLVENAARPTAEQLNAFLDGKRLLLLLDNFEHLVEAAPVVAGACGAGSGTKLLISSRSALQLSGEHTFPLTPLALPDVAETDVAEIAGSEAIALFVERAVAAKPSFALSESNAAAVADLCTRLDGLPLAIELAAARIRVLPPQTILARLNERFGLLTGGSRDAPDRQQTLRAALDWSYDLLSAAERQLFARLSVFAAGCRIADAEAVCGLGAENDLGTLDGIIALAEKSLLRQRDDLDGEPRFWMLESVRAYAAERLAHAPDRDALLDAFVDRFAAFAREAQPHWRDSDLGNRVGVFESELANIRAAVAAAEERDRVAVALELACDLAWLWEARSSREYEEVLQRLRASTPSSEVDLHAYAHAMQLIRVRGRRHIEEAEFHEVIAACLASGRRDVAELVRVMLAYQLMQEGSIEEASVQLAEAEAMAAETGDEGVESWTVGLRAEIHRRQGNIEAARDLLRTHLGRPYYRSNTNHFIVCLTDLAELELSTGNSEAALPLVERALTLARQTNDRLTLPGVLAVRAQVAVLLDDHEQAGLCVEEATRLEQELVAPGSSSPNLEQLRLSRAAIAAAEGDHELASAEGKIALDYFQEHGLTIHPATQLIVDRYLSSSMRREGFEPSTLG
jgi:predicted ATPase